MGADHTDDERGDPKASGKPLEVRTSTSPYVENTGKFAACNMCTISKSFTLRPREVNRAVIDV